MKKTTTFRLDEQTDRHLTDLAKSYLGYETTRTAVLKYLIKQAINKKESEK